MFADYPPVVQQIQNYLWLSGMSSYEKTSLSITPNRINNHVPSRAARGAMLLMSAVRQAGRKEPEPKKSHRKEGKGNTGGGEQRGGAHRGGKIRRRETMVVVADGRKKEWTRMIPYLHRSEQPACGLIPLMHQPTPLIKRPDSSRGDGDGRVTLCDADDSKAATLPLNGLYSQAMHAR